MTEVDGNPNDQTINGELVVDPTHKYADLDELIVNHIQAMAWKVEELMAHEKFKHGTEDDLRQLELFLCLTGYSTQSFNRLVFEKLPCRQPRKEHVWFHSQSQAARAL